MQPRMSMTAMAAMMRVTVCVFDMIVIGDKNDSEDPNMNPGGIMTKA